MSLREHVKASECQYSPIWVQQLLYYIAKHVSVPLHELWTLSQINFTFSWRWHCILRLIMQYRQLHSSTVRYATGYTWRFCGKVEKVLFNVIKISKFNLSILVIDANHCCICILTTTFQYSPLFMLTTTLNISEVPIYVLRSQSSIMRHYIAR